MHSDSTFTCKQILTDTSDVTRAIRIVRYSRLAGRTNVSVQIPRRKLALTQTNVATLGDTRIELSDTDLLEHLKAGGEVPVPYFDGAVIKLIVEIDSPEEGLAALRAFLTLIPSDRVADGRHLIAYLQAMNRAVHGGVLHTVGGQVPSTEQIWQYVKPRTLSVMEQAGTIYIMLAARVSWEEEHGLQMSWANGAQLDKVGELDNDPAQTHAHAGYTFWCGWPEFNTRSDVDLT